MFKKNNKVLSIVTTVITFVFFMWFIYFSYFTAKELLTLKVITTDDYVNTHYRYAKDSCIDYAPNRFKESYSNEVKPKTMTENEFRKVVTDKCISKLEDRASTKQYVDFKYWMLKYGTATLFFLVLFLGFSIQSQIIYRKND